MPLLTWIAEDNHWRGRLLPSRAWPALPPAMVLAWADWRRLGRRRALLTVLAASTLVPALAGAAITGKPHGWTIALALLAAAWLALALTLLVATGVLDGWLWPLLGLLAGPGAAAASLRMARTAPINPADQGPNLPIGATPPWLISRLLSVAVGLVGAYPMLRAVRRPTGPPV